MNESWLAGERWGGRGLAYAKAQEAEMRFVCLRWTKEGLWLEHQDEGVGRASGDRQGPSYGAFGGHAYKDFDLILLIKGRYGG